MSAADPHTEMRLVVLGRAGAGKRSTVSSILGLQDSEQGEEPAGQQECSKHRGEAAGRKLVVVSSPSWFTSDCDPNERRRLISSFISLSSPGPHAFLLCVPVNQPADGETRALNVLEQLLGPSAVSSRTIILFTHTEELDEDERLEDYLSTWRKDLKELAERCGNRYHTLETLGGEEEERRAAEELLEKVEEGGTENFSCSLYEEVEKKVKEKQEEMVRERSGEESVSSPTDEDMEAVRDEAERSVGVLDVDVESLFPPDSVSPAAPSLLWIWWEKISEWMKQMTKLVRREALLGALVGLFVGGPYGGIVGAAVGSVDLCLSLSPPQEQPGVSESGWSNSLFSLHHSSSSHHQRRSLFTESRTSACPRRFLFMSSSSSLYF